MSKATPGTSPALAAVDPVTEAFAALRAADARPPPAEERRARLAALRAAVRAAAEDIARAIDADFGGRPRQETMLAEVGFTLSNIDWTQRRLARWMRPDRPALPLELRPAGARVHRVPLGVVGILAPWNYPLQLALVPLVAALAGGNRVLLKPSEHTPRTAALIARIVQDALPAEVARVVEGGPEAAEAVTRLPLDGLFYTGSTEIGRKVMAAAAENLVPVTLELGGKSPAIVLPDADLTAAAEAILRGKLFSAGQTCIAPDYVLVPRERMDAFLGALRQAARRLYPRPEAGDYAALARPADLDRLRGLLVGHRTVPLMDPMPAPPRMGAMAVPDPDPDSALMREEIFGPVLPVIPYDRPEAARDFANARPCPLALYVFGRDASACARMVEETRSGGALINDTLLHVAAHPLPFGGAGQSGMGAYHGEEGFRAFTRPRSVLVQSRLSLARLAMPPYGARIDRLIRFLLR